MTLHYRRQGNQILILGHTYPHRDAIKKLGGTFNGQVKLWQIDYSESNWNAVSGLCLSLGGTSLSQETIEQDQPTIVIPPAVPIKKTPIPRLETPKGKESLSVSELLEKAASIIASGFPGMTWVEGEIQNLNIKPSAVFFNLAEGVKGSSETNTTTVAASIWNNVLNSLQQKYTRDTLFDILREGQRVRLLVMVNFYKGRASLTLSINDIDLDFTKGALALSREKLLRELRANGQDRLNKNKLIPTFPLRIGLLSAEGSRAVSDFMHQLWEGRYSGEVIFKACPMQGEELPLRLPKDLDLLASQKVDLIVVTRGGGSLADLRWFDAKEIALAISSCAVPIIAAIGHQDDYTIAEEVAHTRAKTPTAAAEIILECFRLAKERLTDLSTRLASSLENRIQLVDSAVSALPARIESSSAMKLQRELEKLNSATSFLTHITLSRGSAAQLQLGNLASQIEKACLNRLAHQEMNLMSSINSVERSLLDQLSKEVMNLNSLEMELTLKNPKELMDKGWTRIEIGGKPIGSAAELFIGQKATARLRDGLICLTVNSIEKK